METLWIPRLAAGLFSLFWTQSFSIEDYVSITFVLAISHSILAFVYAIPKLKLIHQKGTKRIAFFCFLVLVSIPALYWGWPPMFFLFMTHHLINESLIRINPQAQRSTATTLSLLFFELVVFICCAPVEFGKNLFEISPFWRIALLTISFSLIVKQHFNSADTGEVSSLNSFTLVGLIAGLASALTQHPLGLDFFIMYHFSFWVFFPMVKSLKMTRKINFFYLITSTLFALVLLPLTPISGNAVHFNLNEMTALIRSVSYFHILSSLALSEVNPEIVRGFFYERPGHFRELLEKLLLDPWFDKVLAFVACLPFVWGLWHSSSNGQLDFPMIALYINFLMIIVPILIRRPPTQVTLDFRLWALSFFATFWPFLWSSFKGNGPALLPPSLLWSLIALSLGLNVLSRLSLGRSIAFVPSARGIVTSGAYRIVRHPVYTALFINFFVIIVQQYTLQRLLIYGSQALLLVIKAIAEERFLSQDGRYRDYIARVKYRFIPGVY